MYNLSGIDKQSSRQGILEELVKVFTPYAQNLIHSGGDFSYMNMYADNFSDQLLKITNLSDYDIFSILNEACDISWKNQI